MRIAIIGAGIVGVTTAYELSLQGHEVTVLERRGSVASGASFAGGGIISPGSISPWAAPGASWKLLAQCLGATGPARLGGWSSLSRLPWLWRWWRACRPRSHQRHRAAMHQLAQASRLRMLELTRSLHLEFEQSPGCLVLLRRERDLKAAQRGLALMREWGVPHDLVDAPRCRIIEPGLHAATPLHAGIQLPQDGLGNCRQFAHLLKTEAQRLGARFVFDSDVRGLKPGTPAMVEFGKAEPERFDAVVVCGGAEAAPLLARLGLRLPLAAVHAYSVTAPLRHVDGLPPPGPRAALIDERHGVTITRLGQRVRVAGIREIGGTTEHVALAPLRQLYRVLDDWFPGAALARDAQHWKGTMAMTPDGPPILGESGLPGLWLNIGHGESGWALACGSAQVLAERIGGREAALNLNGLTSARLR